MSINMKNPKTPLEKADAISNLVEQMWLSHRIRDEKHFEECHDKAGSLCFELIQQLATGEQS
jgi:hypothetical protein